jgi:hypothetical protein
VAEDGDESDEYETPRGVEKGRRKELLQLDKDDHGNPTLPIFLDNQLPSAETMKRIMRALITYSYCMFYSCLNFCYLIFCGGAYTTDNKAAVPWGQISKTPSRVIKCWDDSVTLEEPTRMSMQQLSTLYWYLHQKGLHKRGVLQWIKLETDDEKEKAMEVVNAEDPDDEELDEKMDWSNLHEKNEKMLYSGKTMGREEQTSEQMTGAIIRKGRNKGEKRARR